MQDFITSKLNRPVAVIIVLLLFIVINGFLFYRYQEGFNEEAAAPEGTVSEQRNEADPTIVHRATSENIIDNSTYLDSPLINGDPDAFLSVTQNWNAGGGAGAYNNHPVGVWYDAYRGGRWAIFNQDLAPMPEGVAFNVTIKESTAAR